MHLRHSFRSLARHRLLFGGTSACVVWLSRSVVRPFEVRVSPRLGTSSWQHLFLNFLALVFPRHRSKHIPGRSLPLPSDLSSCPFRFHRRLSISFASHHRAVPVRISGGPFLLPRPPSCASQGVARPSFPPEKWRCHPARETVQVSWLLRLLSLSPSESHPMQARPGRIERGRPRGSPAPGFLARPGLPPGKREVKCLRSEGSRGAANCGPGGRDGDPLPTVGERDATRRGKNRERLDLLHGDRTSEGVLDVRGVPPGSFGFPRETVPRQWDPSVGGLLPLHPSDAFPGGRETSEKIPGHETPSDGSPRRIPTRWCGAIRGSFGSRDPRGRAHHGWVVDRTVANTRSPRLRDVHSNGVGGQRRLRRRGRTPIVLVLRRRRAGRNGCVRSRIGRTQPRLGTNVHGGTTRDLRRIGRLVCHVRTDAWRRLSTLQHSQHIQVRLWMRWTVG